MVYCAHGVRSLRALSIGGEVKVPPGSIGEILMVVRDEASGCVAYHVHFDCHAGHPLLVRETALEATSGAGAAVLAVAATG